MLSFFFFFQAEDGIRDADVTGVQTCALPILLGYHVDYCPVNDLMVYYQAVEDKEVQALVATYLDRKSVV